MPVIYNERAILPDEFWHYHPIKPIQSLDTLRKIVLERSVKRSPKWNFRTAEETVVELQPKLEVPKFRLPGFMGKTVIGDDDWVITFRLLMSHSPRCLWDASDGYEWGFRTWSVKRSRHTVLNEFDHMGVLGRLIDSLAILNTIRPAMMLPPACLLCGKKLTDPISQARWIGPECNHSASALNPFIVNLTRD